MAQEAQATEAAPSRLSADVYETAGGETYIVEIPVPGLKADEIVIEATSSTLTVSTHPRQAGTDNRHYLQREQPVGPMSRVFEFPMDIDADRVQAKLENGILRIELPKAAAGWRKVIRVGQAA